eukprot:TRINITY_DN1088_c0_g1_i1.p1 TRINITY_DN1088_c0_g1~~TRINITY_DN1088_c0_g1_i1.p1  ORF type:complete len:247 (-),score=51.08 TRINITY_DN1088_c0_g1_i1:81-821(-)
MSKVFISEKEHCQTWLTETLQSDYNLESEEIVISDKNVEINPSIVSMKNLTTINFYKCGIQEIPEELCEMTQLKYLYLGMNPITNEGIPSNFGNLTQLSRLYLSNKLSYIPESINNFVNLEFLALCENNFSNLDFFPGTLTKLTELNFSNTKLNVIPIQIYNIASLTELSLDENNISFLPEEISKLGSLTGLGLQNNQISDFNSLKPMTHLLNLYLYGNSNDKICKNYNFYKETNIEVFFESLEEK